MRDTLSYAGYSLVFEEDFDGPALDFSVSKIYPGIPEYFNADGRGMYHYLTGAASWYMLTVMTEAFGVRGEGGDLIIAPKLVREQFDKDGNAAISFSFAGKRFRVEIANPGGRDFGTYRVGKAYLNGAAQSISEGKAVLFRETASALPEIENTIKIELI